MGYITRFSRYTFHKEGDELIITNVRDDSFEERHDWPEGWTMIDEDLYHKLHKKYYTDLVTTE